MAEVTDTIKKRRLVTMVLLTIGCMSCLTTPIAYTFHSDSLTWIKILIVVPIIFVLVVKTGYTRNSLNGKVFTGLIVILLIFSSNISNRLFLGKQIGYKYLGEDAGFTEIYLYSSGKCKVTYGGILGGTDDQYGTFIRTDSSVIMNTAADITPLTRLTVNIENQVYEIDEIDKGH